MTRDTNQLAHALVKKATEDEKNPTVVAIGRLGELIGGNALAKKIKRKAKKKK